MTYLPWSRVAGLVHDTARAWAAAARPSPLPAEPDDHAEHHLQPRLRSRAQRQPFGWSDLTFKQIVCERLRYFHPVGGGPGGWPKTPPNYLGLGFGGRLQRVHHVESYEVITRPHEYIPEIHEDEDWSGDPHFLYALGPAMEPARKTRSGNLFRNGRVWCSLDLLLTASTISEARDLTRQRHEQAGITYP